LNIKEHDKLLTTEKLKSALENAHKITHINAIKHQENFPKPFTANGIYSLSNGDDIYSGFWTGILWLIYEMSGDTKLKWIAEGNVERFHKRIEEKASVGFGDIGFLYSPSCVAAHKLVRNKVAKSAAIIAANCLLLKYDSSTNVMFAWEDGLEPIQKSIKSSILLNFALLHWASKVTGEERYQEIANKSAITIRERNILPDGRVYFSYYYDKVTKKPLFGSFASSYFADKSLVLTYNPRASAWAIYGLAINYSYTGEKINLHYYKKVTDYFLKRLPENYVSRFEFENSKEIMYYDTSAAVIAVCGMLEMARTGPKDDPDIKRHMVFAKKILNSIIDNYSVSASTGIETLLLGSTHITSKHIYEGGSIIGDYFYLEAIVRSLKEWEPYW